MVSPIYDLHGIVLHEGTVDFGHYTYINRHIHAYKENNSKTSQIDYNATYTHINDMNVYPISEELAQELAFGGTSYRMAGVPGFASRNAYMLIYVKRK